MRETFSRTHLERNIGNFHKQFLCPLAATKKLPDFGVDVHCEDGGAGVEDGRERGHEGRKHDREHEAPQSHRHLLVHLRVPNQLMNDTPKLVANIDYRLSYLSINLGLS